MQVANCGVDFTSINISEPTDSSFILTADGFISVSPLLAAQMHALELRVEYDGELLGHAHMPELQVRGHTAFSLVNNFRVENIHAFNRFAHAILFAPSITWRLIATASISPTVFGISLPTYTDIPFDKSIELRGCNGLTDVSVNVFNMAASTEQHVVANTTVIIQNPSVFAITPVGRLTFDIFYEDSYIGTLRSQDIGLVFGSNFANMVGILAPVNQTAIDKMINLFLTSQDVSLVAVAPANASSIALFNAGMQGLRLPVVLKGQDLDLIHSVSFPRLTMTPLDARHMQLQSTSVVHIKNPLGNAPLGVLWAAMNVRLSYAGHVIASLVTPQLPMTNTAVNEYTAYANQYFRPCILMIYFK
jgi:hypothetical protein